MVILAGVHWSVLCGTKDHIFMHLTRDTFLTQHVLQPARGNRIFDTVLSTQSELVDKAEIHKSLVNSDHNQVHFNITVMTNWDVDRPKIKNNV